MSKLAANSRPKSRRNTVFVGAGAALAAVLAIVGIATVTLPVRCSFGGVDGPCLANVAALLSAPAPKAFAAPHGAVELAAITPAQDEPQLLAADAVLVTAGEPDGAPVALPPADTKPIRRLVKAIVITPSASPAELVALPNTALPEPVAEAPAAIEQAAEVAAPEPDPLVTGAIPETIVAPEPMPRPAFRTAAVNEAPAAAKKSALSRSSATMVVGGSGVNVRATPSMSGGKLFALAPGEKVTVVEKQRGWFRITDDQGRSGWAYSSYLS